ncbi:hypothetical protein ACNHKD_06270 [Methylocystis sp. JAN1]|uniref:hypothetical protein n=1 Tax=Methylocystis sp. JAN1 TaxID=3397211 RepID=UPI003FA22FF1
MIVAVETLFLLAMLSAFIGIVALLALYSAAAQGSPRLRGSLVGTVVAATAAAVGSYFLYALSPHEAARQSVYGAAAPSALTIWGAQPPAAPKRSGARL